MLFIDFSSLDLPKKIIDDLNEKMQEPDSIVRFIELVTGPKIELEEKIEASVKNLQKLLWDEYELEFIKEHKTKEDLKRSVIDLMKLSMEFMFNELKIVSTQKLDELQKRSNTRNT